MAVLKLNFLSKTLGMQTNVTIVFPSFCMADSMLHGGKGIDFVPGMKYQVLYLLHGGGCDDSDYLNYTNIARYADENRLAVIMPNGYLNRYMDYPGFPQYFTYITEELPLVCKTLFPISDKREDTFIGGFSMGANGAFKAALFHPEKYAAALIMSGALTNKVTGGKRVIGGMPRPYVPDDATDTLDEELMRKVTEENLAKHVQMPKFFFAWGSHDDARTLDKVASTYMKSKNLDVYEEEIPGFAHEYDLWDLILRRALNEWLPIRKSIIYSEQPGEMCM